MSGDLLEVGLTRRVELLLRRAGITSTDQVATMTDDELRGVRMLGQGTVDEIRRAIPYRDEAASLAAIARRLLTAPHVYRHLNDAELLGTEPASLTVDGSVDLEPHEREVARRLIEAT